MNQDILDRIRVINKKFTNKLLIRISGKKFGHFVILIHTGRKSGKEYRIPVIAEPFENGFVFALTYGKKVDWYENVQARGSCSIIWKGKIYSLVHPQFISKETGLCAFPRVFRRGLKIMQINYFLKLDIQTQAK
jgi:deazaflavin-dependent oxidoreductase (nitroreductase family)